MEGGQKRGDARMHLLCEFMDSLSSSSSNIEFLSCEGEGGGEGRRNKR